VPPAAPRSQGPAAPEKHPDKWNSAPRPGWRGVFPGDRRLAPVLIEAHRRAAAWTPGANTCGWKPGGRPFKPPVSTRTSICGNGPWMSSCPGPRRLRSEPGFFTGRAGRAYQELETRTARLGLPDCGVCDQDRISLRLEDSLALPLAPPLRPGPRPAGALPLPADLRQAGGEPLAGTPGDGGFALSQPTPLRVAPVVLVRISSLPGSPFMTPCPWGGEPGRDHGRGPGGPRAEDTLVST